MDALLHAFGIDWKLLIAQAVNFGILFVALWLLLYKPVMKTLDERQKLVEKGVQDAKEAQVKRENADTEAASIIGTADKEAEELVRNARMSAAEEKQRLVAEAQMRADQIAKDAQARATEEVAKAKRESEKDIARLALLAAEKVLREKA